MTLRTILEIYVVVGVFFSLICVQDAKKKGMFSNLSKPRMVGAALLAILLAVTWPLLFVIAWVWSKNDR